ncbi:MAG: hypothetical protein WDO24_23120 [Pseudomonadota bacterium]
MLLAQQFAEIVEPRIDRQHEGDATVGPLDRHIDGDNRPGTDRALVEIGDRRLAVANTRRVDSGSGRTGNGADSGSRVFINWLPSTRSSIMFAPGKSSAMMVSARGRKPATSPPGARATARSH